jgi:ATP-dependent RNA helicase RhlE
METRMNFSELALAEPIARAVAEKGYDTPGPIQAQAIPPMLAGHDLLGLAQTGTGKTAAFALPILHRLAAQPKHRLKYATRVLVLAPTRELAAQIAASFQAYGRYLKISVTTAFGGVPIGRQERALAPGVDVLVATPGRLIDLVDRRALDLAQVEVLVLDEADQMLDLGFIHALKQIVRMLPRQRQTCMFSATMPKAIEELAGQYLVKPVQVAVKPAATTAERVDQSVYFVTQPEKLALLQLLLRAPHIDQALVFTRTKHGADRVVRQLAGAGITAEAIHGNKSQPQRTRALTAFRAGEVKVLVATDIAARGLDIPAVSHVFNFELPNVPEQYVHRIGRTGRAGRAGIAISLCADDERPYLKDIERNSRIKLDVLPLPDRFRETVAQIAKAIKALPPTVEAEEPAREDRRDFARRAPGHNPRQGRIGRDNRVAVQPMDGRGGDRRQDRPRTDRPRTDRPAQDRPQGRPAGQKPQGQRQRWR